MKNALEQHLLETIRKDGPVTVAQFMEIALTHPLHGYYMKQDPFGRSGDFTTAPEISQMFGEILGVWAADVWMQMGAPAAFNFIECGPGRGTLMSDMLRATRNIAGFHQAARIHLVEISPVLKKKQKDVLPCDVLWHESVAALPQDLPVILIANEFFDALPIHQYVQTGQGWQERMVTVDENGNFEFTPLWIAGDIVESSPARARCAGQIAKLLEKRGGAALFIDYGSAESGLGDTLQAVYKHEPVEALRHIGDADLSSHVDFEALVKEIDLGESRISGPVTQGSFLKENGIDLRAAQLLKAADGSQAQDIENALKRLTDSDQMGTLFKVMGLSNGRNIHLAGFKSA